MKHGLNRRKKNEGGKRKRGKRAAISTIELHDFSAAEYINQKIKTTHRAGFEPASMAPEAIRISWLPHRCKIALIN